MKELVKDIEFTDKHDKTPMKLSVKETVIVVILGLLTALVAFSIDLYLPAFKTISEALNTDMGKVQVSLSVFLAGLAIGQLFWGTLSDRIGRKTPLVIAMVIYSLISLLVLGTKTIKILWLYRFIQAFSGAAGLVIARAAVTDFFDKNRAIKIFSLLALVSGIAPIIAPSIGNLLLGGNGWHNTFIAMAVLGIVATLSVVFLLPESHHPKKQSSPNVQKSRNVMQSYFHVFKNRQFVIYMVIGSMAFSALMVYIANSPFLIMEKGGFTGTEYSLIFGANAIGLMVGTYSVNPLMRYFTQTKIVTYASVALIIVGFLLVFAVWTQLPVTVILIFLFLFLTLLGILFPTTTTLALTPFHNDSGTASAVLGFAQLAVTFVLSAAIGLLQNNSILPMILMLLGCGLISLAFSITWRKHKR